MIKYIPMVYDDVGEPACPNWECEGEDTPMAALLEALDDWEIAAEFRDHQKITLAKIMETNEIPPESDQEGIRNACEGEWKPGDSWRKWVGTVGVSVIFKDVPTTVAGSGASTCWADDTEKPNTTTQEKQP